MEVQKMKNVTKACKDYQAIRRIDRNLEVENEKVEHCDYCGKNHRAYHKENEGVDEE